MPSHFSDLMKKLPKYAASFTKLFVKKKPRMRQIVCGLQRIAAETKQMQEKSKRVRVAVSAAAAAAVAAAAALFTGSFSFTIFAAVTVSVATVATAVGFTRKHFTRRKGSEKKVKEFMKIVGSLRRELEEMKKVCEDLQEESVAAEAGNAAALRDNVNKLLDITAKLTTSTTLEDVTDVADQCQNAVDEFEDMTRKLKDFRESKD